MGLQKNKRLQLRRDKLSIAIDVFTPNNLGAIVENWGNLHVEEEEVVGREVLEAIKAICDQVVINPKQGMNELVPPTLNTHKVEELDVPMSNEVYEHALFSEANE